MSYTPISSLLQSNLPIYHLTGANTSVGKTIFSTILCRTLRKRDEIPYYLKPVSTGPIEEGDDRFLKRYEWRTKIKCLFRYNDPISPHLAAGNGEALPPTDYDIQSAISYQIREWTHEHDPFKRGMILVEGAGGVHSPTPSGTTQVDAFRPLRMPVYLVGDSKLGGISATISAWESLHIRGYDVESILIFQNEKYKNNDYLEQYFQERGVSITSIPAPPIALPNKEDEIESMNRYYQIVDKTGEVERLIEKSRKSNNLRIQQLESMSEQAHKQIWYPFTQMKHLTPKKILPIDSAYGDYYQTLSPPIDPEHRPRNLLNATFDGSASWWTQGLGHGSPALSLAAAYAAGRYGHTIFASTIHAPALKLTSHLLSKLNNPRLSRIFFSDNGSTGMEVGIKMALTATAKRYGVERYEARNLGVLGLKGSYHGDTIGAMDASEQSTFNAKVHWYKGRGYWFDVPKVWCKDGKWVICSATEDDVVEDEFEELSGVFDAKRDESKLKRKYEGMILEKLEELREEGRKFGALVLEPVVLGAGGMLFCDPLFQRTLINTIRANPQLFGTTTHSASPNNKSWTGLPILSDEVFTGLYRLGHFSSSTLLNINPDISVHAKLLTGGLLPLCVTTASESIYDAFLGDDKAEALLHGHSYTGHAVGCEVARVSLEAMGKLDADEKGQWREWKNDWRHTSAKEEMGIGMWSCWGKDFVKELSGCKDISGVFALGTLLAITLKPRTSVSGSSGIGYLSNTGEEIKKELEEIQRAKGFMPGAVHKGRKSKENFDGAIWNINVRVLGNVVYVMGSQVSKPEDLRLLERRLREVFGLW